MNRALRERVNQWMSPWCKCICRTYPDGTLCKLCGHAHEMTNTEAKGNA